MPNLPTHIHFSSEAVSNIPGLDKELHLGAFIFGATAPDMRALTKKNRSVYHFVDLDFEKVGEGIRNLIGKYPSWGSLSSTNLEEKSFVAGYVSHLILDETWITNMFRPYFGNALVFPEKIHGLVMDRAVQLSLDKTHWNSMKPYLNSIEAYESPVKVDFLYEEPLGKWKEWILKLLRAEFSWERLRFMANRISRNQESRPAMESADAFLASPESKLSDVLGLLPTRAIENFTRAGKCNIAGALERLLA